MIRIWDTFNHNRKTHKECSFSCYCFCFSFS